MQTILIAIPGEKELFYRVYEKGKIAYLTASFEAASKWAHNQRKINEAGLGATFGRLNRMLAMKPPEDATVTAEEAIAFFAELESIENDSA